MKLSEFNDPNTIDYPCSYLWRTYYEETIYGRYLPPIEFIPKLEILSIIPPEHKLYSELQQTKSLLLHLQGKLNNYLDKKKKPKSAENLESIYTSGGVGVGGEGV